MPGFHLFTKLFLKHSYWLFLLFVLPAKAQTTKINKLLQQLTQPLADTSRLKVLGELSAAYTPVDPQKKFYYANTYRLLAEKLHNGHAVADAYLNMGVSYGIRSKTDSALYFFYLAYNQAEKTNYPFVMGKSLMDIGYAHDRVEEYGESIKYYFRALTIFKKINAIQGINQCYTNIGSIYYDLKQYKLAKSYFNECLKNNIANKDTAGIAYSYFTVGNCLSAMGQYPQALDYFTKSLAIRQKLGDINGSALVKKSLGVLYTNLKEYDRAIKYQDSALTSIRALQDRYEMHAILEDMSDAYLGLKDYNNAAKCATEALALARAIKLKIGVAESLEKLVQAYRNNHDIAKAFKYQSEYVAIKDSILAEKALKDVTLTEFSRIRTENAALVKDNELINFKNSSYLNRLNRYFNVIAITAVALLFASLLLLILYRRNREKHVTNKLLLRQKEEIAGINKELEMLNDELTTQMDITSTQNMELARLNDIKNKFFSIVSHDLRAPLSTLQSLFSLYRMGEISGEEMTMLLNKLEDSILTTGTFLDNLLEWSKNQLEGMVIKPINFDIGQCIVENIHLFETKINLKRLNVLNNIDEPLLVHADRDMIDLVVRNLLSNSIKFCDAGDEIVFSAERKGDMMEIAIKDTGPGINQKDREKLFSLEHTLSEGTQGEKGNRLGLILCREMIVQNNGSIRYETEEGKGTTFWVELPAGTHH